MESKAPAHLTACSSIGISVWETVLVPVRVSAGMVTHYAGLLVSPHPPAIRPPRGLPPLLRSRGHETVRLVTPSPPATGALPILASQHQGARRRMGIPVAMVVRVFESSSPPDPRKTGRRMGRTAPRFPRFRPCFAWGFRVSGMSPKIQGKDVRYLLRTLRDSGMERGNG